MKNMMGVNFCTRYTTNQCSFESIHDEIDLWHTGISEQDLHEYLGLTEIEYKDFINNETKFENYLKEKRTC